MQVTNEAARRYALALLELAEQQDVVERVEQDLNTFDALAQESVPLQMVLQSPRVTREERLNALNSCAEALALSTLVTRFLHVTFHNGRQKLLPSITREVHAMLAERRGELSGVVVTAHPMQADQKRKLEDICSQASGKTITLREEVDASLIGGYKLKLGSYEHDFSIDHQLKTLAQHMKGIQYGT